MRALIVPLLVVLLAPLAGATSPPPPPPAPGHTIEVSGDHLTVHATDVPPAVLLADVAGRLGAEIQGAPASPQPITASFEDLPMQDALTRLFGDSFTLIYSRSGTIKAIRFLGAAPTPPKAKPTAKAPPTKPSTPPLPTALRALRRLFMTQPPIPVSGSIAAAAGGQPTATLARIFQIALHDPDATTRNEATRLLATTVEQSPDLRKGTLGALARLPHDSYGPLAKQILGERADEFVGNLALAFQDRTLRQIPVRARVQLVTSRISQGGTPAPTDHP